VTDYPTGPDPRSRTGAELAAALLEPLGLVVRHAELLIARAEPGDFVVRARLDEILAAAERMAQLLDEAEQAPRPAAPSPPRGGPAEDRLLEDLRREFDDPDFIADLVATWAVSGGELLLALRSGLETKNRRAVLTSAHALKSPARAMGAIRLATRAAEIERRAEDAPWTDLAELVEEMSVLVPDSVERLQALARGLS
jgi:HPt (histidine-containing phosphotransfer) domain-containing protein